MRKFNHLKSPSLILYALNPQVGAGGGEASLEPTRKKAKREAAPEGPVSSAGGDPHAPMAPRVREFRWPLWHMRRLLMSNAREVVDFFFQMTHIDCP